MNNDYQTSHDFKEIAHITFKIENEDEICRHEIEEGIYEFYERNEENDNYYKTEVLQDKL